jgi:hypothetical protein
MIFDKSGMWNAVCIGEDKIGAFRSGQGLVEDCILTKPLVLVPEVMDWARQGWGEANDQIASGGGGTIIGDENFHGCSCLVAETRKAQLERANVIVGTDDEGNLI